MTIEHAYGTTEIPTRPARVVTVGYNDQDPVLALGVIPVGVMPWYDDYPLGFFWAEDLYGDTPPEPVGGGEFLEINFEKVAALDPDVGADYTEISAERVEMFADLDIIVWLGTPEEVSSPLYDGLAVTQSGRDVYVDALGELSGAIGFNSAISLPVVIERLVPKLAAAIDGDPTTPVPE